MFRAIPCVSAFSRVFPFPSPRRRSFFLYALRLRPPAFPFYLGKKAEEHHGYVRKNVFTLWFKILTACIPAAIVGLLFDDLIDQYLYNPWVVAIMLILFGVLFIMIENVNRNKKPSVTKLKNLTYKTAFIIGMFQLIAAIFPGTSRSGATIVGALLIGVSRTVAAEFTFFLAIPVMFGASLLKIVKFGFHFTGMEVAILLTGMIVAFVVSVFVIRFLMDYIKKHDFKVFGWYRIVLGVLVIAYFAVSNIMAG